MTGNLDEAIRSLLTDALPALLGGGAPPVSLSVTGGDFALAPNSAEPTASEPRPDDQLDLFLFDPTGIIFDPAAPGYDPDALPRFTLTRPPYPGPRRVRLLTQAGDRITLRENEVVWNDVAPGAFTLALAPSRDLAGVEGVQVLYGVVAVFLLLKLNQTLTVELGSPDAALLEQAQALATAVITLHQQELLDASPATYDAGAHRAALSVRSMKLAQGSSPAPDRRLLTYQIEVELKATRALGSDEGRPIVRVLTPGRPLDPERPVDVEIVVDA